jgi:hypothetical protein
MAVLQGKSSWKKAVFVGIILALIYCLGVGVRWRIVTLLDGSYGGMIFTRESAFYFHFARQLAETGDLPEKDLKAQYPEGFDVEAGHNFAKGKLGAYTYRLFGSGRISFERFVRRFDAVFFCLGILPFFFLVRQMSGNEWISLLASGVYVIAMPALQRSTGAGFNMETFSIPLLFLHLCLFVQGIRSDRIWISLLSGFCLAAAVAGWDFCQFYLLILGLFVFLSIFFLPEWQKLLRHFASLLPGLVLAGMVCGYLRRHQFLVSYGMLLAYPLTVWGTFFFKKPIKKLYIAAAVVVVFSILAVSTFVFFDYSKTYSHAGQKFYSKIKHLNSKPLDPSKLSFTERIEWTPPFHSATEKYLRGTYPFVQMLRYAVPALVPLVLFAMGFFRGRREPSEALIIYNAVAFSVLYLMFVRLKVLLVVFFILALGIGWGYFNRLSGRRRFALKTIWVFVLSGLLIFEIAAAVPVHRNVWKFVPESPGRMAALKGLVEAMSKRTDEDSVVLADFNVAPVILAYAGRSIVLHPKFESSEMRERVRKYYEALFSDSEEELNRFCCRYGADYFVFTYYVWRTEKDDTGWVYSPKYIAGAIEKGYMPYGFRWMVADDSRVAYFRPVPEGTVMVPDLGTGEYVVRYKTFEVVTPQDQEKARDHLVRANEYLETEEPENAAKELLAGIKLFPGLPAEAYTKLGVACMMMGNDEEGLKYMTMGATFTKEGRQ